MSAPIEEWLAAHRGRSRTLRLVLEPARNSRGNLRPRKPLSPGELWARLVQESDGLESAPLAVEGSHGRNG